MQHVAEIRSRWTQDKLVATEREALLDVFKQLRAPHVEEMDGDFASCLPAYSDQAWRAAMRELGKDFWLGKSYRPEPHGFHAGHGHNRYRGQDGATKRLSRFVWDIAPSAVNGNASLVMRYAAFDNWGGRHDLIDEVRVAAPGLFLGIYHTRRPVPGFTPREGGMRSGIEFFLLTGPHAAFAPAHAD